MMKETRLKHAKIYLNKTKVAGLCETERDRYTMVRIHSNGTTSVKERGHHGRRWLYFYTEM